MARARDLLATRDTYLSTSPLFGVQFRTTFDAISVCRFVKTNRNYQDRRHVCIVDDCVWSGAFPRQFRVAVPKRPNATFRGPQGTTGCEPRTTRASWSERRLGLVARDTYLSTSPLFGVQFRTAFDAISVCRVLRKNEPELSGQTTRMYRRRLRLVRRISTTIPRCGTKTPKRDFSGSTRNNRVRAENNTRLVVRTAARARGQRHVPVNLASIWGSISHGF